MNNNFLIKIIRCNFEPLGTGDKLKYGNFAKCFDNKFAKFDRHSLYYENNGKKKCR